MTIIQQPLQMKQVSRGHYLMRNVLKHNVVFNEGAKGDAAYILTEGKIEISGIIEGHKKVFAILKPISLFGEMALFLDEGTRTATATALEDSKVVVVTKDDLQEFLRESPKVIAAIITVLVGRLKSTTRKAMQVPSVGMGVVRTLDLMADHGITTIRYDKTVRSLADTFVTTPERIEGYIHGLADQRLLVVGRDENDTRIIRLREKHLFNEIMRSKQE
ncbi:cyclic nucleotide-binding domain-containing protein [Pseudodesulfovibrio cashew]|uniref:Cyclic nucleotide-binding domain-containing protein n=1 Tax=Pseudodesulfovibrio cashew TaxID=2678688 RepID=A0A6I6JM50_9BACT|nr:cyclic nucleotide-binding domain-containing protein [Pseudodesulfovibrio cashew]QGY38764.1 cyclic nucleotide-binding domain-containing protein [Pseudodesulfovibrio cashew]